eukprot:RCo043364
MIPLEFRNQPARRRVRAQHGLPAQHTVPAEDVEAAVQVHPVLALVKPVLHNRDVGGAKKVIVEHVLHRSHVAAHPNSDEAQPVPAGEEVSTFQVGFLWNLSNDRQPQPLKDVSHHLNFALPLRRPQAGHDNSLPGGHLLVSGKHQVRQRLELVPCNEASVSVAAADGHCGPSQHNVDELVRGNCRKHRRLVLVAGVVRAGRGPGRTFPVVVVKHVRQGARREIFKLHSEFHTVSDVRQNLPHIHHLDPEVLYHLLKPVVLQIGLGDVHGLLVERSCRVQGAHHPGQAGLAHDHQLRHIVLVVLPCQGVARREPLRVHAARAHRRGAVGHSRLLPHRSDHLRQGKPRHCWETRCLCPSTSSLTSFTSHFSLCPSLSLTHQQ